jgi:Family of unknown function (DUF6263)
MTTNRLRAIRRAALALSMAILLAGLGHPIATAAEKVALRWKFKEGEVIRYSMDQTTAQTSQDPEGREIKQNFGLILDMSWKVKSVDASGVASLTQTVDRVRTTLSAPGGLKFSFDSKDLGNITDSKGAANVPGAAGPMFKILLGAEFSSKMSPRGELTDIKLSDKLMATLKADNDPAAAQGPFSEVGLKNILAQMVLPLAETSVDVGDTWKRALAIPAGPDGQTRQIEQTFTYKGHDHASSLPTIEFTSKLDPPKADPNVPVTFKKETETGRIEFDNALGRVAKSTVVEDVEVSVAIQGKEIPQKVQTTWVLTLSKDKTP